MTRSNPTLRRTVFGLVTAFALVFAGQAQAGDKYAIDAVHSAVLFRIKHFGVGHVHGRFNDFSGSFVYNEADPGKSSVELTIKTDSVDTNNGKRDGHLKSPDFFNARQHPVITFKSTAVTKNADGTLTIAGDLTLRGKTGSVTGTITPVGSGKGAKGELRRGFDIASTIKRLDYGVSFMPDGLSNEVDITLSVEGIAE